MEFPQLAGFRSIAAPVGPGVLDCGRAVRAGTDQLHIPTVCALRLDLPDTGMEAGAMLGAKRQSVFERGHREHRRHPRSPVRELGALRQLPQQF